MATNNDYHFDWADLAFGSKKPLRDLQAVFIAAPRELSAERFKQLVKTYLPKGNIVVGIAKEPYVFGLEDCPQFKALQLSSVASIIKKVNTASPQHKIYTLSYSQRDTVFIYEKIPFQEVVLINGSWYHGFHHRPEYYALVNNGTSFTKLSPFASEVEAKDFASKTKLPIVPRKGVFTESEMVQLADQSAAQSYDYAGLQTGCAIGLKNGKNYELIATAHNRVVPYETYAMHHGSERERHFSPLNDQNHYDTVHAETSLVVAAQQQKLDLKDATLFVNLLPCPACARMLCETDVAEVIYQQDHSDGYAVKLLTEAGKTVRRVV
ncbi:hypothetical protein EYC59_06095 [Candidatus Saccharibacteria bacterium]|nr:MAG: hypothetical protein EYC59_06095 [Candidatus Saccharibacteria bacterium]